MTRSLIAASALALFVSIAGAAGAQPPEGGANSGGNGGHGGGAVRQACMADMQKICPDAKPGPGGGMRECMRAHYADLSDGCKAAIEQMRAQHQGGGGGPPPGGQ
jgi:hypothetical protein